MIAVQIYLLKSSIALALLFLIYRMLLWNETDYRWNRIYLLLSIGISIILPLIRIPFRNTSGTNIAILFQPALINGLSQTGHLHNSLNTFNILSIIYIGGATFFSLRFLSGLFRIQLLYLRFAKIKSSGFTTVLLDGNQSPFTFFNILFISRNDFEGIEIDELMAHERAHRDEYHTLDILLMELLTIFLWFNPFVWLFRMALRSLHEFIADRKVLLEGYDPVRYQMLLFEKSLGTTAISLTHYFNPVCRPGRYSLLKKRFKMMSENRSGMISTFRYLLSVPLLILTGLALMIQTNSFAQDEKVYTDVDVMAKYNGGDIRNVTQFLIQNIVYPESAIDKGVSVRMFINFIIDEKGEVEDIKITRTDILEKDSREVKIKDFKPANNPEIDPQAVVDFQNEAIRVTGMLSGFTPAQKDGRNVKTEFTLPIEFALK